jgi:hypothetical protein
MLLSMIMRASTDADGCNGILNVFALAAVYELVFELGLIRFLHLHARNE